MANDDHKEHEGNTAKSTKTDRYSVPFVKDFVNFVVNNTISVSS